MLVLRYLCKRVLSTIPVLFLVSLVVFSMIHLTPGSPARAMLGPEASDEQVAALEEVMGLNDPLPVQYVNWISDLLHGDLGTSVSDNEPVLSMIVSHIGPTISVTIFALIIDLIVALPLGILAARKKGAAADQLVSVVSLFGVSLPDFLLGLLLMLLFAVQLGWFPSSGYVPLSDGLLAHIRSITLPSVALGFTYSALMMRMTKSAMYDALYKDYIKFARAKGVSASGVVMIHALKNASVKLLTIVGQAIVGMLSGAAVIETLFMIPGVGQLIVLSISRRDYEVIQAIVLLVAVINVLIMLLVDILYGLIDPRIKMKGGRGDTP